MAIKAVQKASAEQYWHALKSDDGQALEALYQYYANRLYNYGTKFTSDQELIRECIQVLFVTLWSRRAQLGQPVNVKNYLFKAFRLSLFKKIKIMQKLVPFDDSETYAFQATISIEAAMIIDEDHEVLQQRLQQRLDQLTARQKEAIFLKFYEGLSYQEVAEVMGISVKGTYKIMSRAIDRLREKLDAKDFPLLMLLLSLKFFY